MIEELLAPLLPNQFALVKQFQANIDPGMLREIAEADYGSAADECEVLLRPILKTGLVESDEFCLREALELIRWSEPDTVNWRPGGEGSRGHWMRLFACTALVQRAAMRYPYVEECETLAQLISSAIALGEPVAEATASMLSWRFVTHPGDIEDRPFLAFAILLLAAHLARKKENGEWLNQLVAWLELEETNARAVYSISEEWLFGLTFHRQREGTWRSLAHDVLVAPKWHPPAADAALRRLGALMPKVRPGLEPLQ